MICFFLCNVFSDLEFFCVTIWQFFIFRTKKLIAFKILCYFFYTLTVTGLSSWFLFFFISWQVFIFVLFHEGNMSDLSFMTLSFAKCLHATFSNEQLDISLSGYNLFQTLLCKNCLLTIDFAKKGEVSLFLATLEISFYSSFNFVRF